MTTIKRYIITEVSAELDDEAVQNGKYALLNRVAEAILDQAVSIALIGPFGTRQIADFKNTQWVHEAFDKMWEKSENENSKKTIPYRPGMSEPHKPYTHRDEVEPLMELNMKEYKDEDSSSSPK